MLTRKIISTVFLSLICSIFAFPKDLTHGILFRSSAESIDKRTSLSIFENKLQKFENVVSISFDLSIWDIKQFGYILRVIDEKNQEVDFVFVNFRGDDDLYLDFHSPITHKSVPIPIKKEYLYEKKWLQIKIIFDLKNDRATVNLNDSVYQCHPIGFSNPSRFKFVYGLYGLNLDVPGMAVKNIMISQDKSNEYFFPLNESQGEDVHDNKGHKLGQAKNADWIINSHYYWQEKTTLRVDSSMGVTYDNLNNRIMIVNRDTIISYSPDTDKRDYEIIKNLPFSTSSGGAIYDAHSKRCYLYNLAQHNLSTPSMAIVNMESHSVSYGNPVMNNELYHHNVFLAGDRRVPCIFGGYGQHSYTNKVFAYNIEKDIWEKISFTGDSIMPRYFSAAGPGPNPSDILIMGGVGNESGKQEHGGRHLYDLFLLDMKAMRIKKIWELDDVPVGFVPCSNLVLDENKTHFYTLCYPHHEVNAYMQLYRFCLNDGSYEIVSDSIALKSEKPNTTVYLFYNSMAQEFYSVIREYTDQHDSQVRIYSLLSPPVSQAALNVYQNTPNWYLIIILPFVILLILLFLFRKKIFHRKETLLQQELIGSKDYLWSHPAIQKTNAIYVLGDFTVYDKKGMDISYRFSSKIKALFALILFYSNESSGVSTETLTSDLWPDKDVLSAKNTRGVTINRLRSILSDLDGVSLVFHNSKWFLTFDKTFHCDFLESTIIMDRLENDKTNSRDEDMHQLLNILKRGAIFPGIQELWIDSFKREYENKAEKLLWNYITELYEHKKYTQLIGFSELYFIIDPLNEDIMNLCMKAFQKLGKTEQGMVLYNKFVSKFKDSMGEEPKNKFTF